MTHGAYHPTPEQEAIIGHDGHAFICACPGSGKTRTMVERARHLLSARGDRRGVAILSFTNAAIEELEDRLRKFGILPQPLFPSFIGTFDSFLWQFIVLPFGIAECDRPLRLVPDKPEWEVRPYPAARPLPLKYFDRPSGTLKSDSANRAGFSPTNGPKAWETTARKTLARAMSEGLLDFDDVRACVSKRLADPGFSLRVGAALAGRFSEIVVDEAQDCNPSDLSVVAWLRHSGVKVKIICDPNQAIFGFRGGQTSELMTFRSTFDRGDHLSLSGNFRSSPAICAAVSQLRPPMVRGAHDASLGRYRGETIPVHLFAYGGTKVPTSVGAKFRDLTAAYGIPAAQAPVLATTWASAKAAVGSASPDPGNDKALLLAEAVMGFHLASEAGGRRQALTRLHRATLLVRGDISSEADYSADLPVGGMGDREWRPAMLSLAHALRLGPSEPPDSWLRRARALLNQDLRGPSSIAQRLRSTDKLGSILKDEPPSTSPASTIHAVKGLEFPAVCVVLTTVTAGRIIKVLTGAEADPDYVEDARKLYVAASRAERLLAIATPKSCTRALKALLDAGGHATEVTVLG